MMDLTPLGVISTCKMEKPSPARVVGYCCKLRGASLKIPTSSSRMSCWSRRPQTLRNARLQKLKKEKKIAKVTTPTPKPKAKKPKVATEQR